MSLPDSAVESSILEIFKEEVLELTQEWEQLLVQWEKDIAQLNFVKEMRRVIHTLKGSARMVKFSRLADFCHKLEEVLIKIDEAQAPTIEDLQLVQAYSFALPVVAIGLDPIDSQDKIKLSVQTINSLSKLATSANITRAHLEQQQDVLINHYDALKQNLVALDEQLETLDNQTIDMIMQALLATIHSLSADIELQHTHLREQQRITTSLEEGLTRIKMVSFESFAPRLEALVTELANELEKKIDFRVLEASGEMDRNVLEKLTIPLEHLLRNAIDHGIESPQERLSKGKDNTGVIQLSFVRKGTWVNIKVKDDGRGLSAEKIRDKAIALGYLKPDENLAEDALYNYILLPGFSTRNEITLISGRGIGMDVVNSEVKKLGGNLAIHSVYGEGSTFSIQLPLISTLNQALIFKMQSSLFGVLSYNISGITRVDRAKLRKLLIHKRPFIHNETEYPLHYLGNKLHFGPFESIYPPHERDAFNFLPVLLVKIEHMLCALIIDKVLGFREVLVKPLGRQLEAVPEILGGSILGDASMVLILDVYALSKKHKQESIEKLHALSDSTISYPKILVVDNSVTIRKGLRDILEHHLYEVSEAQDGLLALEALQKEIPDVILLDMEMPNMGGLEVIKNIRSNARLAHLPIIVITSLSSQSHKQSVLEAGANFFLNKPICEAELIGKLQMIILDK